MGSAVGELTGSNKSASRAAGRAARASQHEAQEYYDYQEGISQDVRKAANDPRALLMQEEALGAQSRNLARQEELINAINPALKEAATQALGLLKGEKAASLGPLEQQRARQRQTLLNTLRERLGPNAETSSAGIQALQNFDNQTSDLMGSAQQSSLSGLLGLSAQMRPDIAREAGSLSDLGNVGLNRQISAGQARTGIMAGAFGAKGGTAGANQVENMMRAQQMQRLGGEAFGAAATAIGGMFGGPAGAKMGASLAGGADSGGNPGGGLASMFGSFLGE